MKDLKAILVSSRPIFFTTTLIPLLLGIIIGWYDSGAFNWYYIVLAALSLSLLHAGTNLIDDYYDYKSGADSAMEEETPFSGGSRVLPNNLIEPKKVLYAALIVFFLGSLVGLYLNYLLKGNIILIFGILGVFGGFFYTADPIKLGYRGLGELTVGLTHGPLIVLGGYYLQTQRLSWPAFWASLPVGILVILILMINEFPSAKAYKTVNRRNLVVIWGKEKCLKLYIFLLFLTYFIIVFGVVLKIMPLYTLIALLTLPLALRLGKTMKINYGKIHELVPAKKACIGLHLIIDLLLSSGYILNKLLVG